MKCWGIIVNPVAGGGKCLKRSRKLEEILRGRQLDYTIMYTEYVGHASELVEKFAKLNIKDIMVLGGDGTINEVVQAVGRFEIRLGVIPMGTGNDFAKTLNMPIRWEKALDIILHENFQPFDIGFANSRSFLNVAGTGFDVEVLTNSASAKSHLNGMVSYLLAIFKAFKNYKLHTVKIVSEQLSGEYKLLLIAVGNGSCYAGGMQITPHADAGDGLLEVCMIHDIDRWEFLKLLPKIIKGKHLDSSYVICFRTEKLYLECTEQMQVQTDGEITTDLPCVFRIEKSKVNLFCR